MCGILACLHANHIKNKDEFRSMVLKQSKKIRHRGPDWSGYKLQSTPLGINLICHERLSIIDPLSGKQPLFNQKRNLCLSANGEIYNYLDLKKEHLSDVKFETNSDCEVIVHLFEKYGIYKTVNLLDGMWSFIISDMDTGNFVFARDPIGITPLYFGYDINNCFWVSSEMKSLTDVCYNIMEFPPGYFYCSKTEESFRYFNPKWYDYIPKNKPDSIHDKLRDNLVKAVSKRMMSDVPFGVLLSGGLDSSLIASIANKYVKNNPDNGITQLYSFSIGLKGSPDLEAAQMVADYIDTKHYGFTFTIQEGIDALEDVIYHLETYDITSIRASIPMFLLSRKIKTLGIKMVLSGEGADEIFGGYLYFHKAPNKQEFHKETVRKMKLLHKYDCNRANKSTSAWGIETRTPFLDKEFIEFSMNLDPELKMVQNNIEKYLLRKSFDNQGYIPQDILWRQKEQFSDGVGYNWIDGLKSYADDLISDKSLSRARFVFNNNIPKTKEGYLYRMIFERKFPKETASLVPGGPTIACSTSIAYKWSNTFVDDDASGRSVKDIHLK